MDDRTLDALAERARRAVGEHVVTLVDVRRVPHSRRHPQFNTAALARDLPEADITYLHAPGLGGFRPPLAGSVNTAWREPASAATPTTCRRRSSRPSRRLIARPRPGPPPSCVPRRTLALPSLALADALVARGLPVRHILGPGHVETHALTAGARVVDGRLSYPASRSSSRRAERARERLLARSASPGTTAAGPSSPARRPPRACPGRGGARGCVISGQTPRIRFSRIERAQLRLDPRGAAASAHDERTAVSTRRGRHDPDVDAASDRTTIHQPLAGGGISRGTVVLGDRAPETQRGRGEEWAAGFGAQNAHDRRPSREHDGPRHAAGRVEPSCASSRKIRRPLGSVSVGKRCSVPVRPTATAFHERPRSFENCIANSSSPSPRACQVARPPRRSTVTAKLRTTGAAPEHRASRSARPARLPRRA